MTTRLKGLVVHFDQDIREDDAENWINAIRMMQHVEDVTPLETTHEDHNARMRVRSEVRGKLMTILKDL